MSQSEILKQLKINRTEPPPQRRWRWILLACALAGVAAWWLLGGATLPKVKTAQAAMRTQGGISILDATGYVVARRQATVSAKITGKISEVFIEEGQKVAENQEMARLDATDAKAQLALSQAQWEAAQSQLRDLQVQLAQAQRELKRQEELAARKLVSAQSAEQAQSSVESLQARLAVQHLQVAVAGQMLRVAQVNLDNTIVRAPFAGVIVAKNAQPGEIVSPMSAGGFTRTGIGTLVDMGSLEVEVDVNESFIGRVSPGQPVEARLNAYPDWAIPAEVIAIIPTADRSKATVKVRIAIKLKDPRIVPEMGVRVAFLHDPQTPAEAPSLLVPVAAVLAGESAVFVLADGVVQKRVVKLGQVIGSDRQITDGLRNGERVVLDPPPSLKDGDKVDEEGG